MSVIRSPIVPTEQDRRIYPPLRIRLDLDRALPQRSRDGRRHTSIAPAGNDLGRVERARAVGIPEENHVDALSPESPCGGSRKARPGSRV